VIEPEAALVVVTDGLVERRGEDIDEGLRRVLEATAAAAGGSASTLLRRAIETAGANAAHDDDVTVLVLRRT
jgi:serine phosphatase RsbU (regulator of sigma subunit)